MAPDQKLPMRAVLLQAHSIADDARPGRGAPLATLLFAFIAAGGVALLWAEGFRWSNRGWEYSHGVVALTAAAVSAMVCFLRLRSAIDRRSYLAAALTGTLIGLLATLRFYFDVVGSTDSVAYRALIEWYIRPKIGGAVGLHISLVGFLAETLVLVAHAGGGTRAIESRLPSG
jgi:hypothetical protein